MKKHDRSRQVARRRASWLPRLAEPAHVSEAAEALFQIGSDALLKGERPPTSGKRLTREQEDALAVEAYAPALDPLAHRLDSLIPAWVARLTERLGASQADRVQRTTAPGGPCWN